MTIAGDPTSSKFPDQTFCSFTNSKKYLHQQVFAFKDVFCSKICGLLGRELSGNNTQEKEVKGTRGRIWWKWKGEEKNVSGKGQEEKVVRIYLTKNKLIGSRQIEARRKQGAFTRDRVNCYGKFYSLPASIWKKQVFFLALFHFLSSPLFFVSTFFFLSKARWRLS